MCITGLLNSADKIFAPYNARLDLVLVHTGGASIRGAAATAAELALIP